jgi:hypothetical protein
LILRMHSSRKHDKGSADSVICRTCKTEGEVKSSFKRKEYYSLGRFYYVCRRCGKANRALADEINPKARGIRQVITEAKAIRHQYLTSVADVRFKILVWGPSEKNAEKKDVFEKRRQVRDILRTKGQSAYFSEELGSLRDENGNPLPVDTHELLQIDYFDLVIDIADSPGSLMEAERFAHVLKERLLLWLSRDSQRGFSSGLARSLADIRLPPLYFDKEDIDSCILTLASEDWVNGLRSYEVALDVEEKLIAQARIRSRKWIQ